MKKLLKNTKSCFKSFVSLILVLIIVVNPVYAAESGKCGNSVKWNFDNGILKITGNGEMANFNERHFPDWYSFREEIVEVIIDDGVKSIGNVAFFDCQNLKKVTIADSVTSIGDYAFMQCLKLETVRMSSNVKYVGDAAFKMCESLQSINLFDGLEHIGYEAFFDCRSLVTITVPSTVTTLEDCAFTYCLNLLQAIIQAQIEVLPEWTFYGCDSLSKVTLSNTIKDVEEKAFYDCDNLSNVSIDTSQEIGNKINSSIKEDVLNFGGVRITDEPITNEAISIPNDKDTVQKEVEDNGNSIITSEITKNDDKSFDMSIDAKLESNEGWDFIVEKVDQYVNIKDLYDGSNEKVNNINVNIKTNDKLFINKEIINKFAGQNIVFKIDGDGLSCEIDMKNLDSSKKYSHFTFDYELEEVEHKSGVMFSFVGNARAFYLNFKKSSDMPVTIKIPFGEMYNRNYASLFQKNGSMWKLIQNVQMDNVGTAHFYLNGYDQFTSYLIGLNVEGVSSDNALIPGVLYDDYDGLTDQLGNKYEITGIKSKWGITITTFSLIIGGVLLVVVILIGLTMYIINKRKKTLDEIRQEVMSVNYDKNKKTKKQLKNKNKK